MLDTSWNDIESFVIYGAGLTCEMYIDLILTEFKVSYIIDKTKCDTCFKGIAVYSLDTAKHLLEAKQEKIVVVTSQSVYEAIKQDLMAEGFIEEKDFCRIEQFVVEWYRRNKKLIAIQQLNTAVTTWCTLNCGKCNMFIPHYSNEARQHYSFAEMKDDIDLVLSFIDYICIYNFLGGEPLLNSELKYIIDYVATNYSSRVGRIEITTNGTVELTEELLMILKKHKVLVSISDYTLCVPYKDKLDKFCNELKQHNVEFIRMQKTEWKDFGFPEEPFNYAKNEVVKHMKSCSPMFHGVNDRKVYYCHVEWGAEKAGLYRIPKCDYIDLRELNPNDENDRKKVGDYFRGEFGCTYLDFCRVCGGCGADNPRAIVAGEQV